VTNTFVQWTRWLAAGLIVNRPVDASHQNRSLGDAQLDDGIVDALVSVSTA
jgi:hypothetical protein